MGTAGTNNNRSSYNSQQRQQSTSTQVATTPLDYTALAWGEFTADDMITVRETVGKDCNESQFKLFLGIAKAAGANPLTGEIHPSVMGGKLTVQYGIDLYVRKAKEAPGYDGYETQMIHEKDEFEAEQVEDGEGRQYMKVVKHKILGFPRGNIVGGYFTVYKKGLAPFTVLMDAAEVEHYKRSEKGMQKTMWTNFFADMFKKQMGKRAFKAVFGLQFPDDGEEVPASAGTMSESYQRPEPMDITPEEEQEQYNGPEPEIVDPGGSNQQPEHDDTEEIRKQMFAKFLQLGIKTETRIQDYLDSKELKINKGSRSSYLDVIEALDQDIADQNMEI